MKKNKPNNNEIKIGDLIGVDGGRVFSHGCRDYALLRYGGEGKAIVIEADSCTSCWQVGHDHDHVFATVGDTWEIDTDKMELAEWPWSADIKWVLPY